MLTFPTSEQHPWYAVSTRSRQEKVVAQFLESTGVSVFLPLITEMRRWSDRNKPVAVPLFSGYVFVQIPASNESRVQVLKTPGVVQFVGVRGIPLPVAEKEIRDVKAVLSSSISCMPYPFIKVGQRVRIVGGSLDQIEGTLVGRGPGSKLVISVEIIQRSLAISLSDFEIEPIEKGNNAAA